MKTKMNMKMWRELEQKLIELGAGYKVDVDDHLGIPEMVIHIDTIGVLLAEEEEED
jgi:hypothetical protein